MTKIQMNSSEPLLLIRFFEQMFPGIDLKAMELMLKGTDFGGSVIKVSKKLDESTALNLEIDVTAS